MSESISISWQAQDGYAGGSRPQSFKVDPENYRGLSKNEIEEELWTEVQMNFEQKVTPCCDVSQYADEILKALEESSEEDEE